jgi:hypothetical protein
VLPAFQGFKHRLRSSFTSSKMAHESAACGKVRLYIECAGLVDRDTFSKVNSIAVARAFD